MNLPPSINKILMTADTVGGVWTYALGLCKSLPDIHFILATMGPKASANQRDEASRLANVELVESGLALEWMDEPWQEVEQAADWLLSLEAIHSPDLIHLNGFVHASLPWRAPLLLVAHSCVLSWWHAVKNEAPPERFRRYQDEVQRGIHSAECVIAPTAAMHATIRQNYGKPRRICVIHNAIDPSTFISSRSKEPLVLCAGRLWDEAKNASAVAGVASQLAWPVVLCGDAGGSTASFENVDLAGHCDTATMADWFHRASIYALPARYEPFGLSALEAAHAGAALVLGDIPTLREVWGDAALFVDPDDPSALHQAITSLIENPAFRSRQAAKAKLRAADFRTDRMADSYLQLYQSMIANHRTQAAAQP